MPRSTSLTPMEDQVKCRTVIEHIEELKVVTVKTINTQIQLDIAPILAMTEYKNLPIHQPSQWLVTVV